MNQLNRFLEAFLKSPLVWGGLSSAAFFALLRTGVLGTYFFQRYCAGHVVQYVETTLFFIGLAALALKTLEVAGQFRGLHASLMGPIPAGGQAVADCEHLLHGLRRLPAARQDHYLVRRFRETFEHIFRRNSAETLDNQLQYLAELDAERMHGSYALIRLIIWTIPILGFLGTVVGITMAIASLKADAVQDSMMEVTAGLGVKFDTTALALSLSIILVFIQFFVDRLENALLARVNELAEAEFAGRFVRAPAGTDGQLLAMRRMSEQMAEFVGRQLQAALAEGLKTHVRQMAAAEEALVGKAEILARAVEAAGQVTKLEDALNRNLAALAGSKNFEETVMSLAAAIHLLNVRLGSIPGTAPAVQLERPRRSGQAA